MYLKNNQTNSTVEGESSTSSIRGNSRQRVVMPDDKPTLMDIIKNPPYKNEWYGRVIDYEKWEKQIKEYLRKELE